MGRWTNQQTGVFFEEPSELTTTLKADWIPRWHHHLNHLTDKTTYINVYELIEVLHKEILLYQHNAL